MNKVVIYNRVFDRKHPGLTDFETFLNRPQELMKGFSEKTLDWVIGIIKRTKDKEYRNWLKRNNLPVVKLYPAGILSIDIDELLGDNEKITPIVNKLSQDPYCLACKGTPSKNLVAFYKFECEDKDFPYLFYKKYLELTLELAVNIDFLPEKERLRYISNGEVYFHNKKALTLTEILKVDELPYIFKANDTTMMEDEGDEEVELSKPTKKKRVKRSKRTFIYNS